MPLWYVILALIFSFTLVYIFINCFLISIAALSTSMHASARFELAEFFFKKAVFGQIKET